MGDRFPVEGAKVRAELFNLSPVSVISLIGSALIVTAACSPTSRVLGSYYEEARGGAGATGGQAGNAGNSGNLPTFSSAVVIESLQANGSTTTDPSVTGDGLELFFMSTRSGNKNIWHSIRSKVSADWEEPEVVSELSTDSTESNLKISEDGLELWFFSDRDRSLGTIWHATRTTRTSTFSIPEVVPETLDEGSSEVSACPSTEETFAITSANIDGKTNGYDLLGMSRSDSFSRFGEKQVLKNVNSSEDDFDPWLSVDGLWLVFHSNRNGTDDLFFASRSKLTDDFSTPSPIFELNTNNFREAAPTLTRSKDRLLFASNRDGDEQLYEAVAQE
jgi:Tol biopolymer transport system component